MIEWINYFLLFLNIIIITVIMILYVKIETMVSELSDKYRDQKDLVINIPKS